MDAAQIVQARLDGAKCWRAMPRQDKAEWESAARQVSADRCSAGKTVQSCRRSSDTDKEAVHEASAIRGGASLVHGVQKMNRKKDILM